MRKSIAAAALIAALAATGGCGHARGEDPGPTVSRNYAVGDFRQIEVAGPYDVEVRTGSKPSVSAEGGEKLLGRTKVEVTDGKLIIHPENHHGMFSWGWSTHGNARFVVTVPELRGAHIAGSGDIKVDQVKAESFEGGVAGSGTLSVASLQVQLLKLEIGGSGGIKAGAGNAKTAQYEIAGSGDIDAGSVAVEQARISIAGSGNIRAHATGAADVDVAGSGDVEISGGAKCTVNKHGSGDVRCS